MVESSLKRTGRRSNAVRSIIKFILPCVFIIQLVMGCGSSGSPAVPDVDARDPLQTVTFSPSPESSNRFLWSAGFIRLGDDPSDFEVIPLRQVSGHWNILKFLEQGPCSNCFSIKGVTPTPKGTLQVSVEIIHPFISANLTGFDVRGILMTQGTNNFPLAGLTMASRPLELELVNADGYTSLYNPTTAGSGPGGLQGYIHGKMAGFPWPNTTLNGFKRHVTDNQWNTRNAFYASTVNTQIYEVYKPAGSFLIGYAVDASWVPPINNPVVDPMTDFPPEANCSEPWKIEVKETPVGLGLTASGGQVILSIDVYDYQGKLSHYVPQLECPELFNGKLFTTYTASGDGFGTFEATVSNSKLAPDGIYKCLISVEDLDNDTSPTYLDLTAYKVHELGVGTQAPPNVTGFQASDGDPTLPERRVKLTWEVGSDQVEFYDIERLDYEWPGGWYWKEVKSSAHPQVEWIDGNPRWSGPINPIQYRISARNAAGSSPGYGIDNGYPAPRQFGVAMWCVADDVSGNGAVTNWNRAMADFNDCNSFWNPYGMQFILENSGGFFWIGDPSYKNINWSKAEDMHNAYGEPTYPDDLNVYFINASEGDTTRAYCTANCPAEYYTTENTYVVLSRDARGQPPNELPIVLAHEMGHAIGHFWDIYLLDSNKNLVLDDGTSCIATNTWCNQAPYDDPLFCDPAAAYQQNPDALLKNPWNLMWYSAPGKQIVNYNLIDTQYLSLHDWINTHKSNYPWP